MKNTQNVSKNFLRSLRSLTEGCLKFQVSFILGKRSIIYSQLLKPFSTVSLSKAW